MSEEQRTEEDGAAPRLVGITAPTKDDWSNEFELSDDVFVAAVERTGANAVNSSGEELEWDEIGQRRQASSRPHSRRIVRSLDWTSKGRKRLDTDPTLGEDYDGKTIPRRSVKKSIDSKKGGSLPSKVALSASLREQIEAFRDSESSSFGSSEVLDDGSETRSGKKLESNASFRSCESTDSVSLRKIRRQQVARGQLVRISGGGSGGLGVEKEAISPGAELRDVDDITDGDLKKKNDNVVSRLRKKIKKRGISARLSGLGGETELDKLDLSPHTEEEESEAMFNDISVGPIEAIESDEGLFPVTQLPVKRLTLRTTSSADPQFSISEESEDMEFERTALDQFLQHKASEESETDQDEGDKLERLEEQDKNEDGDVEEDGASSLSSVSDWDAMLEEEEETASRIPSSDGAFRQHLEGLRNLVGEQNEDAPGNNNIPRRWRFATLIKEKKAAPTVVRYPKPSALFSLRTKDGMKFMQEIMLEKWLSQLVSSSREHIAGSSSPVKHKGWHDPDMESTIKKLRTLLGKSMPGSQRWAESFLSLIWTYFADRQDGICVENTLRMFRMLGSSANSEHQKRRFNRSMSSVESGASASSRRTTGSLSPDKRFFLRKMPHSSSVSYSDPAGQQQQQDSNSLANTSMEEDPSEEDFSWDSFLTCVLQCFQIGTMALARTGEAHAAGDLRRARGTSRKSVPSCVYSMVDEAKKWVEAKIPPPCLKCARARLMLLEAESVAHQLATCVLDFRTDATPNMTDSIPSRRRRSSKEGMFSGFGVTRTSSRTGEEDEGSVHSCPSPTSSGASTLAASERCWDFVYHPLESSATKFLSNEAQLAEAVLSQFCKVYLDVTSMEPETMELGVFVEGSPLMLQAECLCDLQLVLCGMSPLTTTETNKLQDALDQLQLELEDWMTSDSSVEAAVLEIVARAEKEQENINISFQGDQEESGISMCIGVVHRNLAEQDRILECEALCAVDPRFRMEKLKELYPRIPSTVVLKAKAAFVLAMYAWDEKRDSETAEELLFECLYVLEALKDSIPQCQDASILGELATNAMVLYGDILVENSKYKYAIGAYEAAVRSYTIREKKDFRWLYRRLCSICVEHMDWDRALKYHLEILHTTKLDTSLNEFVYVSERVAMILLDQRADFAQAESYLKLALSYLGAKHSPNRDTGLETAQVLQVGLPNTRSAASKTMPPVPTAVPGSVAFAVSVASMATPSSSSDAHHRSLRIKLQQRLAHVYLSANRAEDAARLLSQVIGIPHPGSLSLGSPNSHPQQGHHSSFHGMGGGSGLASGSGLTSVPSSSSGIGLVGGGMAGGLSAFSSSQSKHSFDAVVEADNAQSNAPRISALLLLGKACLKLRWLADCTIALDQLAQEVTMYRWCDPNYTTNFSGGIPAVFSPRPRPNKYMIRELLTLLAGIGSDTAISFAVLRAKCCLYQGLSSDAMVWLDEVLSLAGVDPHAPSLSTQLQPIQEKEENDMESEGDGESEGESRPRASFAYASMNIKGSRRPLLGLTLGQIGRLFYYKGKILQLESCPDLLRQVESEGRNIVLSRCKDCGKSLESNKEHSPGSASSTRGMRDNSPSFSPFQNDLPRGILEMRGFEDCARAKQGIRFFWCAFEYFELIDDALWQAKTLSRIAQVEIAVLHNQKQEGKMRDEQEVKDVLNRVEEAASMAIDLCADIGYGPLMIRCLLNMSELSLLKNKPLECWAYWQETRQLLNMIYLTDVISSSPGDDTSAFGVTSSSFSFAETSTNARLQMEDALSTFVMLSKTGALGMDEPAGSTSPTEPRTPQSPSKPAASSTGSSGSGEFTFPDVRVPGIHTPPGLTCRILQHVSRLARVAFDDSLVESCGDVIGRNVDLVATWNWLNDVCWKQHTYCAKIVLQEHVRSTLYDAYLISFSQRAGMRANMSAPSNVKRGSLDNTNGGGRREDGSGLSHSSTLQNLAENASTMHAVAVTSTSSGVMVRKNSHRRNKSDSALGGAGEHGHVHTKEGRHVHQTGKHHKERIKQLRQQLQHDEEDCKRCKMARQAELLTTEGRTNVELWSCFHRLKLLAHGEIGLSLHMEEVHSQNLDLLRKIRDLTRAAKQDKQSASNNHTGPQGGVAAAGAVPFVLFKPPPRRASSAEVTSFRNARFTYALLCGWQGCLVTAVKRKTRAIQNDPDNEGFPIVGKLALEWREPCSGLGRKWLEQVILMEDDTLEPAVHSPPSVQVSVDVQPSLYGLWEIMRSVSEKDLYRLISLVLAEQPILFVSSVLSVKSRAIEGILGLIRPFRWLHSIARVLPAVLAFAMGKILSDSVYIVGLHPCAVADFIAGVEQANREKMDGSPGEEVVNGQRASIPVPTVVNLDDGWIDFSPQASAQAPPLPSSFQSILELAMSKSVSGEEEGKPRSNSATCPVSYMTIRGELVSRPIWGAAARKRCEALHQGMQRVMLWLLRFHSYFYDARTQTFDVEQFCKGMQTEDPVSHFCQRFLETRMFAQFLREDQEKKPPSRIALDDMISTHMSAKAKIYRSLVGLTRGCWVWMVVLDHTVETDSDGEVAGQGTGNSRRSTGAGVFGTTSVTSASSGKSSKDGSQWASLFSSFGLSSSSSRQTLLRDTIVARVAEDIQNMQLHRISTSKSVSGSESVAGQASRSDAALFSVAMTDGARVSSGEPGFQDGSTFFQTKAKKKWIYLEEKRIRYHYRKSKTREKGSVPLDPSRTRLVVPVENYFREDSAAERNRLQATLDRTRKPRLEDAIEDPKPGRDDNHWIYLVTQLKDSNKARTIKLRFLDKLEEQLWMDALRVKLMNPELLIRLLETAYVM